MFNLQDLDQLREDYDTFFDGLPLDEDFSLEWKKGMVRPSGVSYVSVHGHIPALLLPKESTNIDKTNLGELVVEEVRQAVVASRWGKTIEVDGIVYEGGIQINDLMVTKEGASYKVTNKQSRGYGGYYVLTLALDKGYSNAWISSQYPGI